MSAPPLRSWTLPQAWDEEELLGPSYHRDTVCPAQGYQHVATLYLLWAGPAFPFILLFSPYSSATPEVSNLSKAATGLATVSPGGE